MSERNLPIKLVLQKETDTKKPHGGGAIKLFCDVTPQLRDTIATKFEGIMNFYEDVFTENKLVPAVGKIVVKDEAIAKSHKPGELCKHCPIIGSDDLNEIFIKVTKKSLQQTSEMVCNPPTQRMEANLSAVEDIIPILADEKISPSILDIQQQGLFGSIRDRIKIKLFDFNDDFDNSQITEYVILTALQNTPLLLMRL